MKNITNAHMKQACQMVSINAPMKQVGQMVFNKRTRFDSGGDDTRSMSYDKFGQQSEDAYYENTEYTVGRGNDIRFDSGGRGNDIRFDSVGRGNDIRFDSGGRGNDIRFDSVGRGNDIRFDSGGDCRQEDVRSGYGGRIFILLVKYVVLVCSIIYRYIYTVYIFLILASENLVLKKEMPSSDVSIYLISVLILACTKLSGLVIFEKIH